jgi:alpha-2-macroglobulin-like protein
MLFYSRMTAHLVLKVGDSEQVVALGPMNSLGRHPSNSIQILDKIASKEHCLIERRGDRYVLRDLGSLNGTFINSVRVRGESPLVDGDEISIGSTRGIFRCEPVVIEDETIEGNITGAPGSMRPALPEERLLAHLATDKPLYRPGEMLYARAALLDALTRAPAKRTGNLGFEVRSPRGDVVVSRPAPVALGIGAFSWAIPDDATGGEYVLFARCPAESFPPAELSFAIRPLRVPLLRLELELARKAYGAAEEVVAALSVARPSGDIPTGATAVAVASVDGVEVHRSEIALDALGTAALRFRLPPEIDGGEGTLTVTVHDGNVVEPIARAFAIVGQRLVVTFYPEGGDLVVGIPSRLYVEARTPLGKAADVAGRVLDSSGEIVARFRTEHEGRGTMSLTPARSGRAYIALLDEPAGVAEIFTLPEVKREGLVLAALDDITGVEETVRLRVIASAAGKARVTLSVRESEVAAVRLELAAGEVREVALTPPGSADGILRATVFDAAGVPRAERLVFRRPSRGLRVTLEMRPSGPAPPRAEGPPRAGLRSAVVLRVKTTDSAGVPRAATVTLAVTDDALLSAIPPRERAANLVEQVLLGAEVLDFADPSAYLGTGASAARRLDLLLGTQGFRRFAFYDIARFAAEHGDRAERVLARRRKPSAALAQARRMPNVGGARSPSSPPPSVPPPRYSVATLRSQGTPSTRVVAQILPSGWTPENGRRIMARIAPPLLLVREYAHRAAAPFDGTSGDFTETLYWNAGVMTSPNGEAQVNFDLGDAVTTFRARADAFSSAGALGHGEAVLEAGRPFSVEPRLPPEVTSGDLIEVPITISNGTATHADINVSLYITSGFLASREPIALSVGEGRREKVRITLGVMKGRGVFPVTVRASAGLRGDEVIRQVTVVPTGYPVKRYASGRLEPEGSAVHPIRLPDTIELGSIATDLVFHPSSLSMLTHAQEALLLEPTGGFEQAASSAWIDALVLQDLLARQGTDPHTLQHAVEVVERGYTRLVAHERVEGGFEWFGGNPGHAALTALGLMALAEIERVFPVDPALISRTRAWLLARRDGRGFIQELPATRGGGSVPFTRDALSDAYITWALGRSGVSELSAEIAVAEEQALASDDAYHLALAAGAILQERPPSDAARVLARLADKQDADGAVRGAATSITRSGGDNLVVETTAIAILTWLRAGETVRAGLGVRWLFDHGRGGRFGATQATVLALQALLAFEATRTRSKQGGVIEVLVDEALAAKQPFDAEAIDAIVVPSFTKALVPGAQKVTVRMIGGAAMSYTLRVRASTSVKIYPSACKVTIATSLDRPAVTEGESAELRAVLANEATEAMPMVTAILGVPAGFDIRLEALKELVTQGKIDAWEVRGREVVIHLRGLPAGESRTIPLSLLAAVPGTYNGPASRVYLQYTDSEKNWAAPLKARIHPQR